jgi:hypothetical protein
MAANTNHRKKVQIDPEQVKRAIRDSDLPNLVAVACEFHNLVGGPASIARMLFDLYESAPKGGMVRARIMDMVCAHLKFLTPKDEAREKHKYLTDEELEESINKYVTDHIAPLVQENANA